MIEFKKVSKEYDDIKAVDNVSFNIKQGKIIGLLGANGSGKTTIIKMINGLLKPTSGTILVDKNIPGVKSKEVVSYLPENNFLNLEWTVKEIVKYFKCFFEDFDLEKANKMLIEMEIDENKKLKNLSKGTKEKVQLILILCREAKYYILDEPIGGVDPAARKRIIETILKNFNESATVIISTHLISDIEKILDEVIFIKEGEIILQKDAEQLRSEKGMSINDLFKEVY